MTSLMHKLGGYALVLLLLFTIVVIGAHFDLGLYIINLQQTFSGSYGDVFGVALFVAMLFALFGRHFNIMFEMQSFVCEYALSPLFLTMASFMLTGLCNTGTPDIHHQHLVLLIFLFAMYQRFSGSDMKADLTTTKRIFSRAIEIVLYMSFPHYKEIWVWHFMLPSALIVCICRSNEVFRIWQIENHETRSDHILAKKGFDQFYKHVMKKVYNSVDPIPWPNTTTLATTHPGPSKRLLEIKNYLEESGMYGNSQHNKQYGFFWVPGSGLLVLSTIIVATLIFVSLLQAQGTSFKWRLLLCIVSGGNLLYLLVQCLPGLIVFFEKAHELTTVPENTNSLQRIHVGLVERWREEMQDPWFIDIKMFALELLENGLPLGHQQIPFIPWRFHTYTKLEGFELIMYVVIYGSSRALARICLIFLAFLIQITRLNILATNTLKSFVPNLAYGVANLTALDVTRTKRAIIEVEIALDTRKECACSRDIKCIKSICMVSLLEMLEYKFDLDAGTQDLKSQAITVGLLQSTQKKLNEARTQEEICKFSSRCHPILYLLKRIFIDGHKYNLQHVNIVVERLDACFNGMWDDFKKSTSGYSDYKCMTEEDWKLMRIQLQVSLLLFQFHQPSTSPKVVTQKILSEWLESRSNIVGINIGYFIRPLTPTTTYPPSTGASQPPQFVLPP